MAKPTKKELEELALQEAEAKAPASVNKDIMRAIASAKMSLKKKFGDDLFSEKKIEPIPSISTGSALLDRELGNGGWALGRVHEIFGSSSSGKCLTADTYIKTPEGILRIDEIFEMSGNPCFSVVKEIETQFPLINEHGNVEDTTHFTWNGARKVVKLKTRTGNVIKGTHHHPLRVISRGGNIVWRNVEDIQIGDHLVYIVDKESEKKLYEKDDYQNAEAELLGYMYADGTFTTVESGSLRFSNSDKYISERFKNICIELFDKEPNVYSKTGELSSVDHHLNSKEKVVQFFEKWGINKNCRSSEKYISKEIRTQDIKFKREFIRAFAELECSIDPNKSSIEIASASYDMLFQLKNMLISEFGIISFLREKRVQLEGWDEPRLYYRLEISGIDFFKYIDMIGFESPERIAKLNEIDFTRVINTNYHSIPNGVFLAMDYFDSCSQEKNFYPKISSSTDNLTLDKWNIVKSAVKENDGDLELRTKIDSYFNNYIFDEVVAKENIGKQPTFDFAMSETHSFIANGVASHNTSVVSMTCANALKQYPDKYVIYIDYEQAMNFEYAKKLGLDVEDERFIFIQSNSAEEGFETVEKLVQTGGVSVVIIDSVPAMLTKAELEKGFDEMTMGSKAKFLSTSIPKLIELLKKTNTAMIFVNQVRDSLSYGGGQVTPGGKALPFFSSSRVEIKRTQILTNKEIPYGQTVKFFIRKNKVGLPFGTVETDLLFGIGFDYHLETVNLAIDMGIIRKSSSWLKMIHGNKEELVIQGAANFADYYRDNPEDFEDLKRLIKLHEESHSIDENAEQVSAITVDPKFDENGY